MLNRLDPSWSFSTLFLVKDGLAGEGLWVVGAVGMERRSGGMARCRVC
jgi:hypothetical protein